MLAITSCELAHLLAKDNETLTDPDVAVDLWIKAGKAGHVESQMMCARVFEWEEDYETALSWYQRAAMNGNEEAKQRLAELAEERGDVELAMNWKQVSDRDKQDR